jgi:hypothetical protein
MRPHLAAEAPGNDVRSHPAVHCCVMSCGYEKQRDIGAGQGKPTRYTAVQQRFSVSAGTWQGLEEGSRAAGSVH